jgi:hypothetical protein
MKNDASDASDMSAHLVLYVPPLYILFSPLKNDKGFVLTRSFGKVPSLLSLTIISLYI